MYCFFRDKRFVGSFNGLVCIVGCPRRGQIGMSADDIWIWNPCIRQAKKLPLGKHKQTASCTVTFGFGWDPHSNDYKVAKLVSDVEATWGEVWSSKLDSWKEINVDHKIFHPHCVARTTVSDVSVKGGLIAYWVVREAVEGGPYNLLVAYFDMRTEVLQLIPFPKLSRPHDSLLMIIEDRMRWVFCVNWKETFAVADYVRTTNSYDVWTMENATDVNEGNWVKKFTFHLPDFDDFLNSFNGKSIVLKFNHRKIDKYGWETYDYERRGCMLCDVETGETRTLDGRINYECVVGVHDHVMSLLSITGFVPYKEEEEEEDSN